MLSNPPISSTHARRVTIVGPRANRTGSTRLSAQIRYTTGGVPHILAHNWPSLGFGYGYAFAQDNLCTMANDYVTVEAQRSRYFGPKGVYFSRGSGAEVFRKKASIRCTASRKSSRLTGLVT